MAIIAARGLSMRFGDVEAVSDLDLEVQQGQVFGFLGPNGAGKTTTVRLLNGLLEPTAGEATVLGMDVRTQGALVRRETGVLTESPSLYEALTARQNLAFYGDLYGVPSEALLRRVDEVLERFGLSERADDKVGGYSKGMQQRLALARAFMHQPKLLFLDEPTAGLDPAASRMVVELIAEQATTDGRTVFLCTHNLTEAQRLCDVVGVIDRGRLQAVGAPESLARQMWQRIWVDLRLAAAPSAATVAALEALPASSVQVDGARLAVELDGQEPIADLVALLVAQGERVLAVVPREHTLEDIYFRLQSHGEGEEAQR
ncbi:MAG: ABC transporter ATP-binding protein [Anaerolineae bacterium]